MSVVNAAQQLAVLLHEPRCPPHPERATLFFTATAATARHVYDQQRFQTLPKGAPFATVCHMANYSTKLSSVFHALSDPTRRAVVARLAEGGATAVTELAVPFSIGLPTFLKHLKVLEESGIISSVKNGRVRTCKIRPKQLAEAERWLSQRRQLWEERLDRFSTYVESIHQTKEEK